ncbi:hypothetical protein C0J52_21878 [Blattella germanica]|nr:hypothetical protein C0J52_21878 [Blattella germanica]
MRLKFGDHRNDWKCCFCCHVRTGTIFLGIWHLMLQVLALSLIAVVFRHPEMVDDSLMGPVLPTPLSEVEEPIYIISPNIGPSIELSLKPAQSDDGRRQAFATAHGYRDIFTHRSLNNRKSLGCIRTMPRTYLRRLGAKPKRNYNTENLIKAIQAIKVRKLSYRQAAEKYQIPRSTLENKKLPDSVNVEVSNSAAWSSSFEEILKDTRYPSCTAKTRRKRINVPPGKSISGSDLGKEDRIYMECEDIGPLTTNGTSTETDINATEDDVLDIESFVVVNYDYSQGNKLLTRQFVGVVTDIHAKDVDVKFLRPFENKDLNVGVVVTFCTFAITLLMLFGAVKGKPSYLMPFFCLQVFDFCIVSLTAVGYLCYLPDIPRLVADNPQLPFQEELLRLNPQCLSLLVLFTFMVAMMLKVSFYVIIYIL